MLFNLFAYLSSLFSIIVLPVFWLHLSQPMQFSTATTRRPGTPPHKPTNFHFDTHWHAGTAYQPLGLLCTAGCLLPLSNLFNGHVSSHVGVMAAVHNALHRILSNQQCGVSQMCVGRLFFDFDIRQHVGRFPPYFTLACLAPVGLMLPTLFVNRSVAAATDYRDCHRKLELSL